MRTEYQDQPQTATDRVTEQCRRLYAQAPLSNLVIFFVAPILYFIIEPRTDSLLSEVWLAALCISALYRLSLWYAFRSWPERKSMRRWLRHYTIGSGLVGVSWSLIYPLFYLSNDLMVNITLSMLIFGLVSVGIVGLAINLPTFIAYMYPQMITLILTLLVHSETSYNLLALAAVIYLIATTLFTRHLNRNTLQGIDLQTENLALIKELSDEIAQRNSLIEQRTAELANKNDSLREEIRARKRTQSALKMSDKRLAAFFGESPAGMAMLDTDLRYLLINDQLAKINGRSAEQHIGKTVYEILPEASTIIGPIFQQILNSNTPIINTDLSGEVPSRPGEVCHFTVSYFPIPDESNTPVGIGIVVIDITQRKRAEQALKISEERFELAMQGANDGLYDWDLVNNEIYYSPRWKSMLGYQDHELPNDFSIWEDLVDKEDRERSWDMLSDYINGRRDNFNIEFKMRHKDGHWIDILSRASLVRNENGDAVRTVGTHVDISELKSKDRKIKLLSKALEQSPVLIIITDPQADIEYVNPHFERVTGYSAHEVIGQNPRIFQSGLTPRKRYKQLWKALLAKKEWSGEIQNRKKNGEIYWEFAYITPVVDDNNEVTHYLAIKQDITQQKLHQEKILHQAQYDALTNLPNRLLAMDRLTQMLKEAQRSHKKVAVLFVDLDGFKRINDSLGHEVGDQLLIEAAARLGDAIRDEDTVCRMGGDEFIILLKGLSQASEAQYVAENLLARFREAFALNDRELVITASIGVSVYPEDGTSPAELLRNADTAMYHSKSQGRNTYHYFAASMNKDVSRRLGIEEQLRNALDSAEFEVHYQPLIDIKSRQIIGAEALLRWHNALLGQVPPDEFIAIAEQTDAIFELGRYVLAEALQWAARWRADHAADFCIAVNLSPSQFRDPHLPIAIEQQLQRNGLPARALELEITEGLFLSGYADIDTTLNALNQLGVSISMDDFGTGYSSLSYLRSYPFNTLKIDRSFVRDISVDKADLELINAAISMGHGLGLNVIAEGVETEQQLQMLNQLNCDLAQGYLFSKPVNAEQFTRLLQTGIHSPE